MFKPTQHQTQESKPTSPSPTWVFLNIAIPFPKMFSLLWFPFRIPTQIKGLHQFKELSFSLAPPHLRFSKRGSSGGGSPTAPLQIVRTRRGNDRGRHSDADLRKAHLTLRRNGSTNRGEKSNRTRRVRLFSGVPSTKLCWCCGLAHSSTRLPPTHDPRLAGAQ